MKQVTENVKRSFQVCVPTQAKEKRERTVWTTEYKEEEREVTTMKQVTENVKRSFQVAVPTSEVRNVTRTYTVPVMSQEKRTAVYTVCNTVPETQLRCVTNYQKVMVDS